MSNGTAGWQQGLLQRLMFSSVTTVPCCVFLVINGAMLAMLRSSSVFRETPRYLLLTNLLVADTAQLLLSQLLYLLAFFRLRLTFWACGVLVLVTSLASVVSPLTLVAMALERYVAVCFPLRHAALATGRNTAAAVLVVWAASSLNVVTRVVLLLQYPPAAPGGVQMTTYCSNMALLSHPRSALYDSVCMYTVFVSAGVAVVFSYFGVIVAARSASADGRSAQKAGRTLLLHLVQLGLTLLSTIHSPVLLAVSRAVSRAVMVLIQNTLYVLIIQFPRCLSTLIYGLRDRTLRRGLASYLCCRPKL